MTNPLAHDPDRCATCSGKRHRDEPNPLADELWELVDSAQSPPIPPNPPDFPPTSEGH